MSQPGSPTPIFDAVDRSRRDPDAGPPSMLTFRRVAGHAPTADGSSPTVLSLITAARRETGPRHALRR